VRIVLDACVPAGLARFLPGHNVVTVRRLLGTSDLDDGPLLDRLAGQCDAFITVDKNLPFQQNLRGRPFPVILVRAHSNSLEHLVPLAPRLLDAVDRARAGEIRVVGV
jgi:hypothetical protein